MSKRYETMTKEQMLEFVEKCSTTSLCEGCPARKEDELIHPARCIARYLKAEATMKKRWQTITSDEDVKRMREEFLDFCRYKSCRECEFGEIAGNCFIKYLCQEIEVQE